MRRVYIAAEAYHHAETFVREIGLDPRRWAFISEPERVHGLAAGNIVFVLETAHRHPRFNEIRNSALACELQWVPVSLDELKGVRR